MSARRVNLAPPGWRGHRITSAHVREMLAMWNDGFDTLDIAEAFKLPEAMIYAGLPLWRAQ